MVLNKDARGMFFSTSSKRTNFLSLTQDVYHQDGPHLWRDTLGVFLWFTKKATYSKEFILNPVSFGMIYVYVYIYIYSFI